MKENGMPNQAPVEVQVASALDDPTLAQRLDMLRGNRRAFSKAQADAFLHEAARRLRWGGKANTPKITSMGGSA